MEDKLNTTGNPLDLSQSRALRERALRVVPGGTSTMSKRVTAFADPADYPAYIRRAAGCRVEDADGNVYIDYVAALAPIVLGYADPRVDGAVRAQLERGVLFSLPCPEEVDLAELLTTVIPGAEMVRLLKTGAEAATAAVRLARAHTGRDIVLCCGYHGWHDWYAATRPTGGIPPAIAALSHAFAFNDLAAAEALVAAHRDRLACIVVTPALYGVEPAPGFLEGLRRLADNAGALLVYDEIITGFRWALGGAQQRYGVIPDLAVYAKAMANGYPIAALTGRQSVMAPLADNWITSTYAGEALSIAAAIATITVLRDTDAIARLHAAAGELVAGLEQVASAYGMPITVSVPLPGMTFAFGPPAAELAAVNARFIAGCARRGVLIRRDGDGFSLCTMAAHAPADVAQTIDVFAAALAEAAR